MMKRILSILLTLIIVVSVVGCGGQFDPWWPDSELARMIPVVSGAGEVISASDIALSVAAYQVAPERFSMYVEQCKGMGFCEGEELTANRFAARHENGAQLEVRYSAAERTLNVRVVAKGDHAIASEILDEVEDELLTLENGEWDREPLVRIMEIARCAEAISDMLQSLEDDLDSSSAEKLMVEVEELAIQLEEVARHVEVLIDDLLDVEGKLNDPVVQGAIKYPDIAVRVDAAEYKLAGLESEFNEHRNAIEVIAKHVKSLADDIRDRMWEPCFPESLEAVEASR